MIVESFDPPKTVWIEKNGNQISYRNCSGLQIPDKEGEQFIIVELTKGKIFFNKDHCLKIIVE